LPIGNFYAIICKNKNRTQKENKNRFSNKSKPELESLVNVAREATLHRTIQEIAIKPTPTATKHKVVKHFQEQK
jgi:hypothetical protein